MGWVKAHLEAIICFGFIGLMVFTGIYFLGTEEERIQLSELEAGRRPEEIRDIIRERMDSLSRENRKIMAELTGKPLVHYDPAIRRNPFAPLPALDEPAPPPPPPPPNDDPSPPDDDDPVEPPLPPPPPEEKDPFALRGIMVVENEFRVFLQDRETGRVIIVRSGDRAGEYVVERVERDRVFLRKGEKTVELEL